MTIHLSKLIFLVALFLGAAAPAAFAEANCLAGSSAAESAIREGDGASPSVILVGWSFGKWFSGSGGRTRVVQFCVVTMCIALFIMMRKLN